MAEDEHAMQSLHAPSYAQSQFDTIVRRHQDRSGLKLRKTSGHDAIAEVERTRDRPRGQREWDCSPWGIVSYIDVSDEDRKASEAKSIEDSRVARERTLGAWLGTAVAGVAVAGSPLYAFPPVVAVAGIYSPICLLVVTLILVLWRPFMVQLATALPRSGSNYFYLLNVSPRKTHAVLSGALTALDSVATSVVSAATAADYIAAQTSHASIGTWLTVILLVAIALISLCGLKQSAAVTAATLVFHMVVMTVLLVAAAVHWGRNGSSQLVANWNDAKISSSSTAARAIYQGTCVGFLGVTGFETSPDYITLVKKDRFPSMLRNLQAIAIYLNAPLMLLTFAVLPNKDILNNSTILSSVAQVAAGPWLRILLAINAASILCAGILTGIISAAELMTRLTEDGVAPQIFNQLMPKTGAPYISILTFTGLCFAYYGAGAARLSILSGVFAIAFLSVMALFPISALALAFARPRLASDRNASITMTLITFALVLALFIGNVIIAPATLGYFAAYTFVLSAVMLLYANRVSAWKLLWWMCDRSRVTRTWCTTIGRRVLTSRGGPVIVFVKTDEVSRLFRMMLYVYENEETSNVKLVHFYESIESIPSELEANYKLVDEAFPSITVDLLYVQGAFDLTGARVVCDRYKVPRGMAFMGSTDRDKGHSYEDFRDLRIISD